MTLLEHDSHVGLVGATIIELALDSILSLLSYNKIGTVGTEVVQFHLASVIFAHQVEGGDVEMMTIIGPGSNLDLAIHGVFWGLHQWDLEAILIQPATVDLEADGRNPDDQSSGQNDCVILGILQLVVSTIFSVLNLEGNIIYTL